MKTLSTWIGCSVLVIGLAALPAAAENQPDLSGPPAQQNGDHAGGGPGGGRRFNGDRAGRPGDRLMEIVQQLNLTDDQKTKVHEILKSNAANMAENRKAVKAAMEQLHSAMQSKDPDKIKTARENLKQLRDGDRQKIVSQLSTVLTDDQKTKLQELIKDQAGPRMGDRGGMQGPGAPGGPGGPEGRRGEGPLEKLQADIAKLNLTDDQKSQIKSLIQTHRDAMEKYLADHKDQMQQLRRKMEDAMQTRDREAAQAAREEIRKIMEGAPVKPKDLMEQISKVLTEDQAKQLKQMIRQQRQDGPEGRGPGGDEMNGPRDRGAAGQHGRRAPGAPGGPGGRDGGDGGDGGNPPPPPDGGQLDL